MSKPRPLAASDLRSVVNYMGHRTDDVELKCLAFFGRIVVTHGESQRRHLCVGLPPLARLHLDGRFLKKFQQEIQGRRYVNTPTCPETILYFVA